jgi:hypothetical protein
LWQYIFIILKKTSLHKTMKCNEYSFEVWFGMHFISYENSKCGEMS